MTHQDIPRRRGHTNHAYLAQHAAILADALNPTNDIPLTLIAGATSQGDPRKLRGIPCIARGVGGTSPGTNPEARAINREHHAPHGHRRAHWSAEHDALQHLEAQAEAKHRGKKRR